MFDSFLVQSRREGLKSILTLSLFVLLSSLLFFPLVSAGSNGEIIIVNNHTLSMSIDTEIRTTNESPIVWDEKTGTTPIQMFESDDEIGISIYAMNNKFHRITITESIDNKKRPVYLCYNNYMVNYAWNQVNISFCEHYNYGTELRELRRGQSINFEIPDLINGSNAWSIWVGNGAGGGGGLPVCGGLITIMSQNQTSTYIGNTFDFSILGTYDAYSTGCTAILLAWQGNTSATTYSTLPTQFASWSIMHGNGSTMSQYPTYFDNWYLRKPLCVSEGSMKIRSQFVGNYLGKIRYVYSTPQIHTCEEKIIVLNEKDDEIVWFMFAGMMILSVVILFDNSVF